MGWCFCIVHIIIHPYGYVNTGYTFGGNPKIQPALLTCGEIKKPEDLPPVLRDISIKIKYQSLTYGKRATRRALLIAVVS